MSWMRTVAVGLSVASLAGVAVIAQDRPDFTGNWIRTQPSSSSSASYTEQVSQRDDQITVQVQESGSFGGMGTWYRGDPHTYAIGSPANVKKDADGRVRSVTVSWDGPRLVFVRTTTEGANVTTEREAWSLSHDGRELTKETETTDWRGTRRGRTVLQRSAATGK
jgi:hypothetical protein